LLVKTVISAQTKMERSREANGLTFMLLARREQILCELGRHTGMIHVLGMF
jgi:hypothetical protein